MIRRVDTCGPSHEPRRVRRARNLHAWAGSRNANFTVPLAPWDPDSRQQLETGALSASTRRTLRPVNPPTRVGVTARVRNWDNPYGAGDISSDPCSSAVSLYEVQPFQYGALVPRANDSTDGTMAQKRYYYQPPYWSRATAPYGGPYEEDPGVDTDYAAGAYGAAVVGAAMRSCPQDSSRLVLRTRDQGRPNEQTSDKRGGRPAAACGPPAGASGRRAPRKETLRSRGDGRAAALADQCITGVGCGLGSTWIDPRFEPGPQEMFPGGDAAYAHGAHAGGPTFGAFIPYVFQTSGAWDRYVRGFGDGSLVAPVSR